MRGERFTRVSPEHGPAPTRAPAEGWTHALPGRDTLSPQVPLLRRRLRVLFPFPIQTGYIPGLGRGTTERAESLGNEVPGVPADIGVPPVNDSPKPLASPSRRRAPPRLPAPRTRGAPAASDLCPRCHAGSRQPRHLRFTALGRSKVPATKLSLTPQSEVPFPAGPRESSPGRSRKGLHFLVKHGFSVPG